MASLEQEDCSVLDLNLSLGGLFSQLPCTRLKPSHSRDSHQPKRARILFCQELPPDDDSPNHLSIASCSKPTQNPEPLSHRLDVSVEENDEHLSSNGSTHRVLSDNAKKTMVGDQVHCGYGAISIISNMLLSKRKSIFENEEGTVCRGNSAVSKLADEGSSTRKKASMAEAPRSRCGSNSDLHGSVDPVPEQLSQSSMMYMHPSAMLPVQGAYSVPVQWGFNLPIPMQYSSYAMPPHSCLPWITPFVRDASGGLLPSVPASSYLEGDFEESFSKETALMTVPSSENRMLQGVPHTREMPLAGVCTAMSAPEKEVCMSASSTLPPSCCMSLTANHSSEVCISQKQTFMSATSGVTKCLNDSVEQVDSAKEESGWKINFSSSTQEGSLKSVSCPQKFHEASPPGNGVCGQEKHSLSSGQKQSKTARFCYDQREVVKSISSEKKMRTSSFKSRDQLVEKRPGTGKEVSCNLPRQNGVVSDRITEDYEEDEESDDSRITSESSDQGETVRLGKGEVRAGKLEDIFAAGLPRVSTTCAGSNGKTIHGVMYITESKLACLICRCHGIHMSPSEFVQHSGSTDLRNPERSIVISGLSYGTLVV